ncbi:MAG: uncharacterized protein KVP18_000113 [Porospora cf. gigantea A]|uniref:uncharacterized protein n=1 Tax=Porospora cf. gigantea A TaxID=2853593 RepID=UPI003559A5BC|nr:MAG: hypothetical protein KVP18_000113 [Porospora cf. gigantea A]
MLPKRSRIRLRYPSGHQPRTIRQFLPLGQGGATYLGLVDSGSQLNLLDERLLHHLSATTTRPAGPPQNIRGITGTPQKIKEWVQLTLHLENGSDVTKTFAVVTDGSYAVVLGLPFLSTLSAAHHPKRETLLTPKDP